MMNNLTESQKIMLKRRLLISSIVRHIDSNNTTLKNAIKLADEYNEMLNDGDLESALEHLPYVTQSLIRYAEETSLHKDELQIKNTLELNKKNHIISALKSFNAFTKTVGNKKPTSPNKKTDGLSDAERKVIQSLK